MKLKVNMETRNRLQKELVIAQQLNNLKFYKIVRALLLIAEGETSNKISKLFHVNERTIFHWLSRFMWDRFNWLLGYHYKGRGRKSKLSKEQKKKLYMIVENGPESYGLDCGVWNSVMILNVIEKEFGVTYNPRYLCDLLKKIGLSYPASA